MRKKIIIVRVCSKCKERKALKNFPIVESKGPGKRRETRCRECLRTIKKKYRKPSSPEAAKRWREENPEKAREAVRRWQRENPEKSAANTRAWREKNPERHSQLLRNRRARKTGAQGSHSPEEIQQMYSDQGGLCAYCERELSGQYHIEHMTPLSKGGTDDWSNIAITCQGCNNRKHSKTVEEFFRGVAERFNAPGC